MGLKEELRQNVAVSDIEDHDSREHGEGVCIKLYESATPTINGAITTVLHEHEYFVDELYHRPEREEYDLYSYPTDQHPG